MMGNMMEKLQAMQQQMEQSKKRLEAVSVDVASPDNLVKVVFTGNKKLKSIQVSPELLGRNDAEELEDHLVLAINKGLEAAEKIWESEMRGMAGSLMPGMGM